VREKKKEKKKKERKKKKRKKERKKEKKEKSFPYHLIIDHIILNLERENTRPKDNNLKFCVHLH